MATANSARVLSRLTRFSLRTFLAAVVIGGAFTGIIVSRAMYVVRVVECVPEIEKHNVQVLSDFYGRYGIYAWDRRGKRVEVIEWCLSDPEFITVLSCETPVADSLMEKLATLHTLKQLNAANISAVGLRHIARLPNLETLHLHNSAIDDNSFAMLVQLPKLQRLHLDNIPITDRALTHVIRWLTLKELHLHKTEVTPRGVSSLRECRPDLRIEFAT